MSNPMSGLLTGFGPVLPNTHPVDLARTGLGTLLALLELAGLAQVMVPGAGLRLIAPFGASCLPCRTARWRSHGRCLWGTRFRQWLPWQCCGRCHKGYGSCPWRSPLHHGNDVDPCAASSGGALAMLAALAPDATLAQGWAFVLLTVAVGSAVGVALIWHSISGRAYPQRQVEAMIDAPRILGIVTRSDLVSALAREVARR